MVPFFDDQVGSPFFSYCLHKMFLSIQEQSTSNLWDRGGRCRGRSSRGGDDGFRKGTCGIQAVHPVIRFGFLRPTHVSRWDPGRISDTVKDNRLKNLDETMGAFRDAPKDSKVSKPSDK